MEMPYVSRKYLHIILTLLFFRVIFILNESCILKDDLKNLRRYRERNNVHKWDMCRELKYSTVLHFYIKQCSYYECNKNKTQYLKKS